jgi:hypothetical protein
MIRSVFVQRQAQVLSRRGTAPSPAGISLQDEMLEFFAERRIAQKTGALREQAPQPRPSGHGFAPGWKFQERGVNAAEAIAFRAFGWRR